MKIFLNLDELILDQNYKLNNLIAIIDRNRLQSIEDTETTLSLEPLREKFLSFNWSVDVIDGHNHNDISSALSCFDKNKPKVIIANTTKGKGVSFMENNVLWHYKSPSKEDLIKAKGELS